MGELIAAVEQMVEGQVEDLALEGRSLTEVSASRYLRMARGKTGALFGCAAALGAVLADASPAVVRALQPRRGLPDPRPPARPVGRQRAHREARRHGLDPRKKTLPLVLAATSDCADDRRIAALLGTAPLAAAS